MAQLHRSALVLALLGICLQAAVASLGGRLCFRTSSDAGQSCCFDACCESDSADDDHGLLSALFNFALGGCPADSDCCIDQPVTPLFHSTGTGEQLPALAIVAWLSPNIVASASAFTPSFELRPFESPQPPPELLPIRATVLII